MSNWQYSKAIKHPKWNYALILLFITIILSILLYIFPEPIILNLFLIVFVVSLLFITYIYTSLKE